MIAIPVIALAAGAASALMYASVVSGALISLLLFCLAPLPLMVAALGWGPLGATIGGITAAAAPPPAFRLPLLLALPRPRGRATRRLFRLASLHRLRRHGGAARLVARPSRVARTATAQCRVRQWRGA